MDFEEWRVISEFPTYEVSSHGNVRNLSTGRELKQTMNEDTGLLWVPLHKQLRQYTRTVHKLVANEFLFPGPPDCVPIHVDGDRSNNRADNLDWKTLSYARDLTRERAKTKPFDPRRVMHVKSGVIYENALEAARHVGGFEMQVLMAAGSAGNISYKGSDWEYVR